MKLFKRNYSHLSRKPRNEKLSSNIIILRFLKREKFDAVHNNNLQVHDIFNVQSVWRILNSIVKKEPFCSKEQIAVTGLKTSVNPSRSMWDDRLNLEKLLFGIVATDDCEAKSTVWFEQSRADTLSLELWWISREERSLLLVTVT